MPNLRDLVETLPQQGTVQWIGIRPSRRNPVELVQQVEVATDQGLVGDHYASTSGNRHVTLIQAEHLDAVASMLGISSVDPARVRRNIVVNGINLLALKDKEFSIGTASLLFTGRCQPCSLMEKEFGAGGYNALRGHGGITAKVIIAGTIKVGDSVQYLHA